MSGTHTSLDAAAADRKARLAKLASLKRKQPGSDTTVPPSIPSAHDHEADQTLETKTTGIYLSGRNYDKENNAPKLGFEHAPNAQAETIEAQAERLAQAAADKAAQDEAEAEKGIDLFKLQPKKPNWDLKRDLAEKMQVLDVRTQNAIAQLVKQRIEKKKKEALSRGEDSNIEGAEEVGMDGSTLVEGVHLRERQEEEEERKARELEDDIL